MASLRLPASPLVQHLAFRAHAAPRLQLSSSVRHATPSANAAKYKRSDASTKSKRKKKTSSSFTMPDLKQAEQFTLCDAMRYIRAFEVGRNPTSSKYEVAIRLRTLKNGPVIRNRFRLPHPVSTDLRICVIAPADSKHGQAAKAAGASIVGEEEVFEMMKEGKLEIDRCLCHPDSLQKMNKAGLGRVLGPKGLMPSFKTNTVVKDVATAVRDMAGGSEYRERVGVIRLAIGQLAFTPDEMQRNIKALMDNLKKDCSLISDRISKEIHEVVLSSTNSPGFSLNGAFRSDRSVPITALSS